MHGIDTGKIIQVCLAVTLMAPLTVAAEVAYVIDRIEVGLHQENSLDSPIIKLLATGDELEILARDDKLAQVRDEADVTGWIKNEYLQPEKPTRRLFEEVSSRNTQLKNEISKLEARLQQQQDQPQLQALSEENSKLQQEIKSVRLQAGELQAEISKLRKTAAPVSGDAGADNQALYQRISELEQQNIELEDKLALLRNPPDEGSIKQEILALKSRSGDLKRHLVYILVALAIGLILGLLIYDIFHRRKHSGFRV
jgi:SH3 domain protein